MFLNRNCLGWWRVLNDGGTSGWIPSNYVDETNAPPPKATAPVQDFSTPTNGSNQLDQSYQYNNGMSNFSAQPTSFSSGAGGRVLEVSQQHCRWNICDFRLLLLCTALTHKTPKSCRSEKESNWKLLTILHTTQVFFLHFPYLTAPLRLV